MIEEQLKELRKDLLAVRLYGRRLIDAGEYEGAKGVLQRGLSIANLSLIGRVVPVKTILESDEVYTKLLVGFIDEWLSIVNTALDEEVQ